MHDIDLPGRARQCTSIWNLMHESADAAERGDPRRAKRLVGAHERNVEPFRAQQRRQLSRLIRHSTGRRRQRADQPEPQALGIRAHAVARSTLSLPAFRALRRKASNMRTVHSGAL